MSEGNGKGNSGSAFEAISFRSRVVKGENLFCFRTSRAEFYLFSLPFDPDPRVALISFTFGIRLQRANTKLPRVCNGHRASGTGRKGKLLLQFRAAAWKSPSNNSCRTSFLQKVPPAKEVGGGGKSHHRPVFFFFLISLKN